MSTKIKIEDSHNTNICNTNHVKMRFDKLAKNYEADFLTEEIGARLLSKAEDVKAEMPTVLNLGAGAGTLETISPAKLKNSYWVHADISANMLQKNTSSNKIQLNAEEALPFKNASFDLVISNLMFPWINDIPSTLIRMGRACKKSGLVLASPLGPESFKELKDVFNTLEGENRNPRFMPFADVKEMGKLMQQTGFELPVSDRDIVTIEYPNVDTLFADLKNAGATNLHTARNKGLHTKNFSNSVKEVYTKKYATEEGSIPVTIEVIYLQGFRPNT